MKEIVNVISWSYHVPFKLALVDSFDMTNLIPILLPDASREVPELLITRFISLPIDILI